MDWEVVVIILLGCATICGIGFLVRIGYLLSEYRRLYRRITMPEDDVRTEREERRGTQRRAIPIP